MEKRSYVSLIAMIICSLIPVSGLWAAENDWQAKAAEAIDLVNESGMASWYNNLPMLWSEPDPIRSWFGPKVHQDKLQEALTIFKTIPDHAIDNQMALAWATSEGNLGKHQALELLTHENLQGRIDFRLYELDLALYLREWDLAESLADELEAEGVQSGLTYRRAIIAKLKGQGMMAESLWREAVDEGLPVTQAAYKEISKSGLQALVNQPNISSKVRNYLNTIGFIERREVITAALIPEGYQKGIAAYEAGHYEEAIREWRGVSVSVEMRLSLEYMIGQALNKLKRYDESEKLWRETIKKSPKFFLGYLGLAESLRGRGQHQKAEDWLKIGFRRTNSVFLLNNMAITPAILKDAQGWTRPGNLPGYQDVELGEPLLKDADSLWISWNYGRDWLLYPYFTNHLALPTGKEYWLKGTGSGRGLDYPDLALRVKTINKSAVISPITVKNTGMGELPIVSGEWSTPVELRFEYWKTGEPRFVVKEKALSSHRLLLENAAPGRTYHYRAYVTMDGYEVSLTQGEFSMEDAPFWVGMRRPAGMASFRESRVGISIIGEDMGSLSLAEIRWAEEGKEWSAWTDVQSVLTLMLSPQNGSRKIQFQFKGQKGQVSPILSENAAMDRDAPCFLKLHWRKSDGKNLIDWQTDEPSVSRVWIRLHNQWREAAEEVIYNQGHQLELPKDTEKVQLWTEDQAGNLAVGYDNSDIGIPPVSLRINGNDSYTAERLVRLSLGWVKKPADTMLRFSNDGKLWGPWKPIDDSFQWRLDAGEGEKTVYAQIRKDENSYQMTAKITLDQTPPRLINLELKNDEQGTDAVWNTSKNTRARFYWATNGEALHYAEENTYTGSHRLSLGRLKNARYIWRLELQDEAGNLTVLTDGWFNYQGEGKKIVQVEWGVSGEELGKQRIWLQFAPSDNQPLKVRLRNRGSEWEPWRTLEKRCLWTLKSGFDRQWVEAQFMDDNGNISPISCRLFSSEIRPARLYGLSIQDGAKGPILSWRSDKKVRGWVLIQRQNAGKYGEYARESLLEYSMGGTISLTRSEPGLYRIRLFAEDPSGNWSWSPWIEYSVQVSGMP